MGQKKSNITHFSKESTGQLSDTKNYNPLNLKSTLNIISKFRKLTNKHQTSHSRRFSTTSRRPLILRFSKIGTWMDGRSFNQGVFINPSSISLRIFNDDG
jgi:hypothetical protein